MSKNWSREVGDLVLPENFVLATRDTGYRSPAYALAELVDNAIQAGASQVIICITSPREHRASDRNRGGRQWARY